MRLTEFKSSPLKLQSIASNISALVGIEMEMIVPIIIDKVSEIDDMDYDNKIQAISDINDFFKSNGYNVDVVCRNLSNEFNNWLYDRANAAFDKEETNIIKSYIEDAFEDLSDKEYDEEYNFIISGKSKGFENYKLDWLKDWSEDNESSLEYRWLQDKNLIWLSDIGKKYDLTWPYKKTSPINKNLEELADEFSWAIGYPVDYSSEYHGKMKGEKNFMIEPDTSITPYEEGESGLEFVSPPLSFSESINVLKKTQVWAKKIGCYTNTSTGLHINISLPGVDLKNIDYLKLAILSNDEYILTEFDRGLSSYLTPVMDRVKNYLKNDLGIASDLLKNMKTDINTYSLRMMSLEYFRHTFIGHNVSMNLRNEYIEFRSPGHNWLSFNFDVLAATISRYIIALNAASNENILKQEYLKKLYLLISKATANEKEPTWAEWYAKFLSGNISKEELISKLKKNQ